MLHVFCIQSSSEILLEAVTKVEMKGSTKKPRDAVLRHVSELTSVLKRKDPLCRGNRGALTARINVMVHPER